MTSEKHPTPEEIEQYLRQLVGNQGGEQEHDDDCEHADHIESSLIAKGGLVGLAVDPDSDHYIPVFTFTLEGEMASEIGVLMPDPTSVLKMMQGLLACLVDQQGMDEMKETFLRTYNRMKETHAMPLMVELANQGDALLTNKDVKVRGMRKPPSDG